MEAGKKSCGHMIPQEIIDEILVRFPVPSLVRFKAVSRDWRTTIESECFLERHYEFQKSRGGQARFLAVSGDTRYNHLAFDTLFFSTTGIVHEISAYPPVTPTHLFEGSKISESCDGLFCLYSDTCMSILNPATTCFRTLPYLASTLPYVQHRDHTLLGIGRENSEKRRYKLVCYFERDGESTECIVFALDSNTWRYVGMPTHCRVYYGRHSLVHLDGVIYCFTRDHDIEPEHAKVLAFDLRTERFQSFSIPSNVGFRYSGKSGMLVLNHRLCIFDNDTLLQIWGLNIKMRSWEMMHSINFSSFPPQLQNLSIINPMAKINNYVVISNDFHNFWVLYNSKTHDLYRTFSHGIMAYFGMPYSETFISPYQ